MVYAMCNMVTEPHHITIEAEFSLSHLSTLKGYFVMLMTVTVYFCCIFFVDINYDCRVLFFFKKRKKTKSII